MPLPRAEVAEWPLYGFIAIESHANMDDETALDHWSSAVNAMLSAMAG